MSKKKLQAKQQSPPPTDSAPSSKWLYALVILLAIVTVVPYAQTLSHDFVAVDDEDYVYGNPHVQQGLKVSTIRWAFTTFHASNWHPLTWLSHAVDCQIYGLKPWGHHLTALLLHLANTLLLFLVLNRLTRSPYRSAFVAALFAVHPLHVESVAWTAERKDVLSIFFWLMTMYAYTIYAERPNLVRYLLVVVLLALGLMAKPMLVTLPIILLLLDYWPLRRFRPERNPANTRLILEKIPLLVLVACSCVLTFMAQRTGGAVATLEKWPLAVRITNAILAYSLYVYKMVFPFRLAVFYPHPGKIPPFPHIFAAAAFLIITSIFVLRKRKSYPYLLVGWLWFLITLVPVIGIVQVGMQAMADRYTYITLTGLFLIIAWGVPDLVASRLPRYTSVVPIVPAIAIATVTCLTYLTWIQTSHWKNSQVLFEHALKVTSGNYWVYGHLGGLLAKRGDTEKGYLYCSKAVDLKPDFVPALNNLGVVLAQRGEYDAAAHYFLRAVLTNPKYPGLLENLARAYLDGGDYSSAAHYYEEVLRQEPNSLDLHIALAKAYLGSGNCQSAIKTYKKTLQLMPRSAEAYAGLGDAYFDCGMIQNATNAYRKALEINPQYAPAHNGMGILLGSTGNLQESIKYLKEAISIQPAYADAHGNLALAFFLSGRYAESWREIRLCQRYGGTPDPALVRDLSRIMPPPPGH